MASYASFTLSAILVGAARVNRPDLIVATSPHLLCACAGYALARWFKSPLSVREAIRRPSSDRTWLERMGKNGRDFVLEHYDRRRLAHRYFAGMEETLGRRPAG